MKHRRILCLCAALAMVLSASAHAAYGDVKKGAWYESAVTLCTKNDWMQGVGGDRFDPDGVVSRGTAVTVLWRFMGAPEAPEEARFSDVTPGIWYESAARWAASKGIVNGYGDGRFGPDDGVTREQLAAILWRVAGAPAPKGDGAAFSDAGKIDAYASDAARWAKEQGIMDGVGGGRFDPKSGATRAQLAQIIQNYAIVKQGAENVKQDNRGFTEFDSALIDFLAAQGFEKENYMVSPTSYRAALALAVAGADGETKAQLLSAMGFADLDAVNRWYAGVQSAVDDFAGELKAERERFEKDRSDPDFGFMYENQKAPDRAFEIANSVWHNADKEGRLKESYRQYVGEHYGAAAGDERAKALTGAVNGWVNEKTHGLIPMIAGDLSKQDAVLVNALYLRTSWVSAFKEFATRPGDFTTADGSTVEKQFMHQQDDFRYYEDGSCQVLDLPMKGGIHAAFVLGDAGNLTEKLSKATREEVNVTLPKFELETSFDQGELVNFLRARGVQLPFSAEGADFSLMSEGSDWFISDIIQKSRIKLDEDGIEAAAVTAIMMEATSALVEPVQPKYFVADHPFTFCLYTDCGGENELLFYGQVVK